MRLATAFENLTGTDISDASATILPFRLHADSTEHARRRSFPRPCYVALYPIVLSLAIWPRLGVLMMLCGKWGAKHVPTDKLSLHGAHGCKPFTEINPDLMRNPGLPMLMGLRSSSGGWGCSCFPGILTLVHFKAHTQPGTGGHTLQFPPCRSCCGSQGDIDSNPAANISQIGYQALLDHAPLARLRRIK